MKLLYNTTFIFTQAHEKDLMTWLHDCWLPAAAMAGMSQPLCAHVPQPTETDECKAVAVQGRFDSDSECEAWHQNESQVLLGRLYEQYGGQITGFTTVMEIFEP
ncbi:MAG: DUF4286 family protein [Muribaculaceae bacterium]|nr:DUF4286 family protein [Muribaculaceae bacterium]